MKAGMMIRSSQAIGVAMTKTRMTKSGTKGSSVARTALGAGVHVAYVVAVAVERVPIAGRALLQDAQRQGADLVEDAAPQLDVDQQRRALQDTAPGLAQDEVEGDDDGDAADQGDQRRRALKEHDTVINLQDEDRQTQRQDVDEQRQQHDLAERGHQRLQQLFQPCLVMGHPHVGIVPRAAPSRHHLMTWAFSLSHKGLMVVSLIQR